MSAGHLVRQCRDELAPETILDFGLTGFGTPRKARCDTALYGIDRYIKLGHKLGSRPAILSNILNPRFAGLSSGESRWSKPRWTRVVTKQDMNCIVLWPVGPPRTIKCNYKIITKASICTFKPCVHRQSTNFVVGQDDDQPQRTLFQLKRTFNAFPEFQQGPCSCLNVCSSSPLCSVHIWGINVTAYRIRFVLQVPEPRDCSCGISNLQAYEPQQSSQPFEGGCLKAQ